MLGLGLSLASGPGRVASNPPPGEGIEIDATFAVTDLAPGDPVGEADIKILGSFTGASVHANDTINQAECAEFEQDMDLPYKRGGVVVSDPDLAVYFNPDNRPSSPNQIDFFELRFPAGFHNYIADAVIDNEVPDDMAVALAWDAFGGNNGDECLLQRHREALNNGFGTWGTHGNAEGVSRLIPCTAWKQYVCWSIRGGYLIWYVKDFATKAFMQSGIGPVTLDDIPYNQLTDYIGTPGVAHWVGRQNYVWTREATFLQPVTLPAPTDLELAVLGPTSMQLTWVSPCSIFLVEEWDGSAWSDYDTFHIGSAEVRTNNFTLVITGLEVGDVRKYRLTAIHGFAPGGDSVYSEVSEESNEVDITEPEPGPGTELEYSQGGSDDNSLAFRTHLSHGSKVTIVTGFDITRGEIRVYALGTPPAGTMTMQIWTEVGNQPAVKLYESSAVDRATLTPNAYNTVSFPGFVGTISPGDYFVVINVSSLDPDDSHRIFWIRQNGSQIFRSSNDGTTWGDNTGPAVGELKLYSH